MQTKWTLMGLLCVLMVGVVVAQSTSQSGQDPSRSGYSSSSSMQSQQSQAMGTTSVDLARGSSIIGAKVINAQGEDIGKIQDVVLNSQRDQISYAAVSHGGVAGIGEKYVAIPWSEFKVQAVAGERSMNPLKSKKHTTTSTTSMEESAQSSTEQPGQMSSTEQGRYGTQQTAQTHRLIWNREQNIEVTLNVSKDQFDKVAGFNKDNWPEQASANWQQAEATRPSDQPAMSSEQKAQFETRQLSKIVGMKVESATPISFRETSSSSTEPQSSTSREGMSSSSRSTAGHTSIGKIKDCVLNSDNGRLIYCVVALDDVPNHTRDLSVVPWDTVRVSTTEGKHIAQLQITSGQNLLAFTFRSNQQPDLADRTYLERVYTAYNVEPQWEALGFVPPSGTRDQMRQQRQNQMQQQRQDRQQQQQER